MMDSTNLRKFAVVSRNDVVSIKVSTTLQKRLIEGGFLYSELNPELVLIIGSDETFLSAVHKYLPQLDGIYFAGIHTGEESVYLDYAWSELDILINDLLVGRPITDKMRLVQIDAGEEKYCAVGKIKITPTSDAEMKISIGDSFTENVTAREVSFYTQAGAMALPQDENYPKIIKGIDLLEMIYIENISSKPAVPVIFGNTNKAYISFDKPTRLRLHFDRWQTDTKEVSKLEIRLSDKQLNLVHYQH